MKKKRVIVFFTFSQNFETCQKMTDLGYSDFTSMYGNPIFLKWTAQSK